MSICKFKKICGFSFDSSSDCESKSSCENQCEKNTYDFVIVGAGLAGCVLANRLSENGKYSIAVIEAGRDDSKRAPLLPEPSTANVPQPGDFQWQLYERGGVNFLGPLLSRGFNSWNFWTKNRDDPNSRSITYWRGATWGGCSSHNATTAIRNGPYNWDKWAALGLDEWSFNNIAPYYKLVENRSQKNATGQLYYDPSIAEPNQGSFNNTYYGLNGYLPLTHIVFNPFESVFNTAVNLALNTSGPNGFGPGGFSYPLSVDLDNPDTAALGGTSLTNTTTTDQHGSIIPPNQSSYVPFATYNQPLYGDNGFVIPPEFAQLNVPIPVTPVTLPSFPILTGLNNVQRASAANTYLYPALNRKNLKVISEALVTKIITSGKGKKLKATGVEYLEGWNIYQTGRNDSIERAGFGGTNADARYNALLSKQNGIKRIYASKEVILCGGCFNSPQLLMLSGIGNKSDLRKVGIKTKKHLPGVGQNLWDAQEIFMFWQTQNNRPLPVTLAAKSTPSQPTTNFELQFGAAPDGQSLEGQDPFVQKTWNGVKNLGALLIQFERNNPNNLLNSGEFTNNPATTYVPFYTNPQFRTGLLVELEENNRSRGFLRLTSKDPTAPPFIVGNYLQDPQDLQDFVDVFMNNVFPMMLALGTQGYFQQLLDPSPNDILINGVTSFTNINQIDQTKLRAWLSNRVGGHHAGGSCKMGIKSDQMAVVDQKGKVYGIKGVRVCDLSIVPLSIRWPNINLYPIAEKIAVDIKNKYKM